MRALTELQPIRLGTRHIGPDHPVVVIAEIGVNHEGDPATCFRLVEMAARAGADAVKFQTLDADENYVPGTESHAVFSKAQLTPDATGEAFRLARSLGMEVMTTCGDMETLTWVDNLEPAAHKISSGLVTHLPLIRAAAATGRPLIISTGMCDIVLVREAVMAAKTAGATELCLLQCTSIYPAPIDSLNLRSIRVLGREFGVPVGFSDHSLGGEAAGLAVAAGAMVIEKHFSLDPSRPGFDHRLSVDQAGLKAMVQAVRRAEVMLGSEEKACSTQQAIAAQRYLRSIVARRDIKPGEILTLENVGFMRTLPEKRGLPPAAWDKLAGGQAVRKLARYQAIRLDDIAPRA
jgi:sialic acid synthase SpsE